MPDELTLRAKPRPVKRFNRNALMVTATVLSVLIIGAGAYALRSPSAADGASNRELYNTTNKTMPDAFAALPASYADVRDEPVLGPPLPGDIGVGMVARDRAEQHLDNPFRYEPASASRPAAAAASGGVSERDTARSSDLFFIERTNGAGALGRTAASASLSNTPDFDSLAALAALGPSSAPAFGPANDPNFQSRKEDFLGEAVDTQIYNPHRLQTPISPYQVMAGTIIPASLVTGLNSDLPGQVIAQVTENVYDTPSGEYLLIPQGTRLIGRYDSVVAFGQSRALMVWTRIIMPDGTSMVIDNLPGTDTSGYAGVKDRVDHHYLELFGAAILSSVLSVGSELGRDTDDSEIIEALRDGGQRTINQAGQQVVNRQLAVQPTITVRPGWRLRVIVNRDLVLQPYGG
ncbi:MAG: TrbI/VirB10 family protein [Pseudomonadota bacterium]